MFFFLLPFPCSASNEYGHGATARSAMAAQLTLPQILAAVRECVRVAGGSERTAGTSVAVGKGHTRPSRAVKDGGLSLSAEHGQGAADTAFTFPSTPLICSLLSFLSPWALLPMNHLSTEGWFIFCLRGVQCTFAAKTRSLSCAFSSQNSADGEGKLLKFGVSEMQGWRTNMEVCAAYLPQNLSRDEISTQTRAHARTHTDTHRHRHARTHAHARTRTHTHAYLHTHGTDDSWRKLSLPGCAHHCARLDRRRLSLCCF